MGIPVVNEQMFLPPIGNEGNLMNAAAQRTFQTSDDGSEHDIYDRTNSKAAMDPLGLSHQISSHMRRTDKNFGTSEKPRQRRKTRFSIVIRVQDISQAQLQEHRIKLQIQRNR